MEEAAMEKRSIETTTEDPDIANRPGWEGMRVWWLASTAETGANQIVVNVSEFPPGRAHEIHCHPAAEEAVYVLRGSGLHTTPGGATRQREGEMIFIPRGEWHGLTNDSNEPLIVLAVYGGVGTPEEAGYVVHQGASQ
jgi:quercetin dioxygenase-like cupin family protein